MPITSLQKLQDIGYPVSFHIADPNQSNTTWVGYGQAQPNAGFVAPPNPYTETSGDITNPENINISTGFKDIEIGTETQFLRVPLDGTEENTATVAVGGGYVSQTAPTTQINVNLNQNSIDVDVTEMLRWYLSNIGQNRMKILAKGAMTEVNPPDQPFPYGYDFMGNPIGNNLIPSESYMITQPSGNVDGVEEIVTDQNRRATVEFHSFGETADQYPRFRGGYFSTTMSNQNTCASTGNGILITVNPTTSDLTIVLDRKVAVVDRFWRLAKTSITETDGIDGQLVFFTSSSPVIPTANTIGSVTLIDFTESQNSVTLNFGSYAVASNLGSLYQNLTNIPADNLTFTSNLGNRKFFELSRLITSPSGTVTGPFGDQVFLDNFQTVDDGTYLYFPQGITLTSSDTPLVSSGDGTKRFKIKKAFVNGTSLRLETTTVFSNNSSSNSLNSIPISTGFNKPKLIVKINNALTTTKPPGSSTFISTGLKFGSDIVTNPDKTLAPVGDPTHIAYRNHCVARWVAPQFAEYNTLTKIPILAYHISGISRVDFYLNGGPAKSVTNVTYNAAIGVTCYNVDINPDEIGDREVNEMRAIIYPIAGYPQVLQGEVQGGTSTQSVVEGNIRYGHCSYFFTTNSKGTLRSPSYYVNGQTGLDTNDGLIPSRPKLTIEGALIASASSNTKDSKAVDGTKIFLMDNAGATLEYTIGTVGFTGFNSSPARLNNLSRYVTITPYADSKVIITGKGNANGLFINKYHFKNLTFIKSRNLFESFGNMFSFGNPNTKTYTNPANDKSYSMGGEYSKHIFIENCYYDNNFQKQFALNGSWEKRVQGYVQEEGELPDGVEIIPRLLPGEQVSSDSYITRAQVWWYGYSGWTYNPHWGTSSDNENRDWEFKGQEVFNSGTVGTMSIVGSTFEYIGSFTKGIGEHFAVLLNTNSKYAFEDVHRDVGCVVNCKHEYIDGHPLNAPKILTQRIVGLGDTGANCTGRPHSDILQIYAGRGQIRNCIYYGMQHINFNVQGPWMNGHTFPDPPEAFPITLESTADDYEPVWSRYGIGEEGWGMVRDVVFDGCVLLKNSDSQTRLFSVGDENPHGNIIIKNSILGNNNSTSGYRASGGSTPVSTEVAKRRYYGMVRPSLIENSANGSLDDNARKLFLNSQNTAWIEAGSPLYWESPALRGNLPQGKFIYDFRGQLPTAIEIPNVTKNQGNPQTGVGGGEPGVGEEGFTALLETEGPTGGNDWLIRSSGVTLPVGDRITYFGLDSTTGQTTSFGLAFNRQASQAFMRKTSDPATTYLILLGPSAGSTFTTRAGIHVSTNINDGLQSSFSNSTDQMQWKLDFIAERFNTGWTGYIENITQGLTYSFTDILTPSRASENIYFKGSNTFMPFALGDQVKLTLKYAFNENQL